MNADDLKRAEELAGAAMPGQWYYNGYSTIFSAAKEDDHDIVAYVQPHHGDTAGPQEGANAEFIAHSDPIWVMDAVRRIRALEAMLTRWNAWADVDGAVDRLPVLYDETQALLSKETT